MDREFAVFIGIVVLLLGSIIGLCIGIDAYSCSAYERVTGKPTKFVSAECFIEDRGQWFSWSEYKYHMSGNRPEASK